MPMMAMGSGSVHGFELPFTIGEPFTIDEPFSDGTLPSREVGRGAIFLRV